MNRTGKLGNWWNQEDGESYGIGEAGELTDRTGYTLERKDRERLWPVHTGEGLELLELVPDTPKKCGGYIIYVKKVA